MAGYNPGDLLIDDLTISSPTKGTWQAAPNFLSGNVTETMFTPVVLAHINVLDDRDWLGDLKTLKGDETVTFTYRNPAGTRASYNFHLNSVKDIESQGPEASKTYTLECVTREPLHAQVNHVQRSYNTTIGEMIADIVQKDFKGQMAKTAETKGKRRFAVPNQPALHWVDKMRAEAVSAKNKGSNFMFYQTWRGFYFQSLEDMFDDPDAKVFKRENTIGSSLSKTVDDNILAWKVIQNFNATNRIHSGVMNQRISTYDPHTHKFVSQDLKPKTEELNSLGRGLITTLATFLEIFADGIQHHHRMVNPNKNTDISKSYVPETIPYKQLNLAQMQEQEIHMTVIGDPNLEPGKTIMANVPQVSANMNNKKPDPQVSGRLLISKVQHEFRMPQDRPRWISNLECLKGAYQESV